MKQMSESLGMRAMVSKMPIERLAEVWLTEDDRYDGGTVMAWVSISA